MKRRSVTDGSDWYSWTSGSLRPAYYPDYARYFVKWIQAMQAEGIGIDAVTVQNEPLNHGNSMSLYMTWAEQRDFIKTALGPAFERGGTQTKILVFDHNYNYDNQADQKNYPLRIYADPEASKYVAGSAWHNYGGSVTELDNIVRNAPDKEIYFTRPRSEPGTIPLTNVCWTTSTPSSCRPSPGVARELRFGIWCWTRSGGRTVRRTAAARPATGR